MFRRHKTFNYFYALILMLNIYALVTHNQLARFIALPLIAMSLMLYLLIKTRIEDKFHQLIFIGLVLSLAGDIQLLFTTGTGFFLITALIATMFAYGLYAAAYFIDFKQDVSKSKRVGNILLILLLISALSFYWVSRKNLGYYQYPGLIYFLALALMTVLAGYRYKRVGRVSFKLILTGSFAFLISDLSIGYYKFIEPEHSMMISFQLTYLIAQYLVVIGSIERRLIYSAPKDVVQS